MKLIKSLRAIDQYRENIIDIYYHRPPHFRLKFRLIAINLLFFFRNRDVLNHSHTQYFQCSIKWRILSTKWFKLHGLFSRILLPFIQLIYEIKTLRSFVLLLLLGSCHYATQLELNGRYITM